MAVINSIKMPDENEPRDLIDKNFYSLIANDYDSSLTYEVGDYCIYNHCLYKCITAVTTPGAFDLNKWQQLNVADCI